MQLSFLKDQQGVADDERAMAEKPGALKMAQLWWFVGDNWCNSPEMSGQRNEQATIDSFNGQLPKVIEDWFEGLRASLRIHCCRAYKTYTPVAAWFNDHFGR